MHWTQLPGWQSGSFVSQWPVLFYFINPAHAVLVGKQGHKLYLSTGTHWKLTNVEIRDRSCSGPPSPTGR
jgi:hypothetical protein